MANAVEVAIESALLDHLRSLTFSPAITVAWPNVDFVPPIAGPNIKWLRPTFLPADSIALGVDYSANNQHFGIFQIDVFYGQGSGELAPGRIATSVIAWFKRGTKLTKDGFSVEVTRVPFRRRMIKDDPWVFIPISIPYLAFASNPA
jgi:hypothetical protein